MTSVPFRLLQELYWAEQHIDRPKNRDTAIERYNRIRDQFNAVAHPEEEELTPAFIVPSARHQYAPHGEVYVLPVEYESQIVGWIQKCSGYAGNGGFGSPYNTRMIWPTREKAIRAGVGHIIHWMLREKARSDTPKSGITECERTIAECRKILSPAPVQASLF